MCEGIPWAYGLSMVQQFVRRIRLQQFIDARSGSADGEMVENGVARPDGGFSGRFGSCFRS